MADEPYVPVGGWEAAGYSAAPTYQAPVQNAFSPQAVDPNKNYPQPQQLLAYNSGIAAGPAAYNPNTPQQLIASPTQQGYNNAGPLMTNQFSPSRGGAGGGSPAIAQHTAATTNNAGGFAGAANPYGNLSGVPQFPDPTGGASNGSLYPGGDYNDQFNAPYDPAGGADLMSGNPFPRNPYGDLSGNTLDPMQDFQGSYDPQKAARPAAQIPQPQSPSQPYQMPTTPATYGGLEPSFDAMSNRDLQSFDQTYMDTSNGPYGSLLGGNDGPTTYETMNGSPLSPPRPPIDTSFQNPRQAMMSPTGANSFASPAAMPSQQQFAQRPQMGSGMDARQAIANAISPTQQPQMSPQASAYGALTRNNFAPSPAPQSQSYGDLSRNWTPPQAPQEFGAKLTNRAPQTGGFMSLGANVAGRRY